MHIHKYWGWLIAALSEDLELGKGISIRVDNELRNAVAVLVRKGYTEFVAVILAAIDELGLSYSIG